jgi:aldehyde dehydrogenase (NAD+)
MTQFKNFISGERVDGNDSAPNVNPSETSDVIGHFARARADQTQQAIASARSAFRLMR